MKPRAPLTRDTIEAAKARVSIFTAWAELAPGTKLPARDGVYDAPWATNKGSLSIFANGLAFRDHANDSKGDVVNFIAALLRCDRAEAIRTLYKLAGVSDGSLPSIPAPKPTERAKKAKEPKPRVSLRALTIGEMKTIASNRGFPFFAGLEIMRAHGMLFAANLNDGTERNVPHIIIANAEQTVELRRRIDGKKLTAWDKSEMKWLAQNQGPKSKIWVREEGDKTAIGFHRVTDSTNTIYVVEGAPDAWAFYTLAFDAGVQSRKDWALIIMPDSGTSFTELQLAMMRGRNVEIIAQADFNAKPDEKRDCGDLAAKKWGEALSQAGAYVSIFRLRSAKANFLPESGKDLADAARLSFSKHAAPAKPMMPLSFEIFKNILP